MTESAGWMMLTVVLTVCIPALCADPGLVAYYPLDEGSGNVARDMSGNGNDGVIHGAKFAANGDGYCLLFDGVKDYVDCGEKPFSNMTKQVTLEAWVQASKPSAGQTGVLGKAISSYMLTYHSAERFHFYINGSKNSTSMRTSSGTWHHVVASFDGLQLKLYEDGGLKWTRTINVDQIAKGKNFYIGRLVGDAAKGPDQPGSTFFSGKIDEVKIYNRALSADDVKASFNSGVKKLDLLAEFQDITPVHTISGGDISVSAGKRGQLQVNTGEQSYTVETSYSYPGQKIGWNKLSNDPSGSEANWSATIKKVSPQSLQIEAHGKFYNLRRTVKIKDGKIAFEDKITNLDNEPVGVNLWNTLTYRNAFLDKVNPGKKGYGANPSFFLAGEQGNTVVLLEDNVSRMHYNAVLGVPANQARFRVSDLVLDVGKSMTLRWSIYPLGKTDDYFVFINRRRRELNSNYKVDGSFRFLRLGAPKTEDFWMPLDDPEQLKAYLKRMRLGIVCVIPFMDYTPGPEGRVWPRAKYKKEMQKAYRALKAADPDLKVIGAIECDWVAIDPKKIKDGHLLPAAKVGGTSSNPVLTPEQTRILDESDSPWKDSMKRNPQGNATMELYVRSDTPQSALAVYPIVGNYQYKHMMGQLKFLFDEVGFDGVYIDQFAMTVSVTKTYDKWDGFSGELDEKTGRIARKYFDANIAGISARVNICKYVLDRGKIFVGNTYVTSLEEQALPVNRFSEDWNAFDPMAIADGEKPPLVAYLLQGTLSSPIGMGLEKKEKPDAGPRTIKGVIGYLRHGLLYYHYYVKDIPITGPGSGEYGPINHMFPITIVGVHEGWVDGKERTITCVSGVYDWKNEREPKILLFDVNGREVDHKFKAEKTKDGWRVKIDLKDWAQIAVIE